MRFLCIKEIYSVRPILLKPSENMLPTYGHKFGECSRDVQTLRLFECHLAVANCTAFSNITIRFSEHFLLKIMYRVFIGLYY